MANLGYVIHYVPNVDTALTFFETAFQIKRRFITDENDYGELDTGATVLAFASHDLGASNFSGGYVRADESDSPLGAELALVTDDVVKTHRAALGLGASELAPPKVKPWGQTVSYLRCPSGILIELCTPIESQQL